MKDFFKGLAKFLGILIAIFLIAYAGLKLFYPELLDITLFEEEGKEVVEEQFTIGYADDITSLEPATNQQANRARLNNIYEGLVGTDANLRIVPKLALSWGLLDDTTWEFKLRKKVRFHDGKTFSADDVKASIERAKNHGNSQVKNLLSTIKEVRVVDSWKVQIVTIQPDPLLLNKLVYIYIYPQDAGDTIATEPNGTGPYQFVEWKKGEQVELSRNDSYWGQKGVFRTVRLRTIVDKTERLKAIKNGEIDMLVAVPPNEVDNLTGAGVDVRTVPSLQVDFLMFNLDPMIEDNIFANTRVREAVNVALQKEELANYVGGYAHAMNQYVSNGIFGYDPSIPDSEYDIEKAKAFIRTVKSLKRLETDLDIMNGMESFGNYIKTQLGRIGIDITVNYHAPEDLQRLIAAGETPFYYMGWRSETGDATELLQTVVHSKTDDGNYGRFNGSTYSNPEVDRLIEASEVNTNELSRLGQLRMIQRTVVDDHIGVPLLEYDAIYALHADYPWTPRVDGYVFINEINQ